MGESLCYIAQYAKLKENGIDECVSPKKKLRSLIFYMKKQHKDKSFKPYKLWDSRPPKATKPKYKKRAKSKCFEIMSPKKKKLLNKQKSVTMSAKIGSLEKISKKKEKRVNNKVPTKYFEELYEKEMKA